MRIVWQRFVYFVFNLYFFFVIVIRTCILINISGITIWHIDVILMPTVNYLNAPFRFLNLITGMYYHDINGILVPTKRQMILTAESELFDFLNNLIDLVGICEIIALL